MGDGPRAARGDLISLSANQPVRRGDCGMHVAAVLTLAEPMRYGDWSWRLEAGEPLREPLWR